MLWRRARVIALLPKVSTEPAKRFQRGAKKDSEGSPSPVGRRVMSAGSEHSPVLLPHVKLPDHALAGASRWVIEDCLH